MRRRLLIRLTAGLVPAVTLAIYARPLYAQPTYKVSADQLRRALATRFPRSYPVSGLFSLTLQPPELRFMSDQNRMGARMLVDAAGPALRQPSAGLFDVDFALRYEASDLSIRAAQLRVNTLALDSLQAGAAALLSAYGPALAEQALQGVVLHQLNPQDLALPDGMGLQPGNITVTSTGLVVAFVPKPLS